ncbi:MAG: SCO family protein [Nitrosomonadales bacterium]|nr:SCO family protein [Nitrosomonadales bacterium]
MWLRSLIVIALLALLADCEEPRLPSPFHAGDVSAQFAQADFQLTDHNGKPRTLADFRGKVAVLFFGYTHCPDICPTTLADLAQVKRKLGQDADKLQVLFVTLDPERDTRELLAQYVPAFDPEFLGLYGDLQATAQAGKVFDVTFEKQKTSSGYSLDHSTGTFLIGPDGKVRLRAPYGQRTEWMVDDIKLLLAMQRS